MAYDIATTPTGRDHKRKNTKRSGQVRSTNRTGQVAGMLQKVSEAQVAR